ncbi:MAG: hypothetical protein EON58_19000 [Alphaproteobacteria bacterium]|nr:MAG: hypothetical protein EON58_19000 [Alphaproteobacteria bacterium]
MDSAISNALKRREELASELEEIDQFLTLYRRFAGEEVGALQPSVVTVDTPAATGEQKEEEESVDADAPPSLASRKRGWSKDALRPHIEEAIRSTGKPLTRGQILRALDAKEIPVGGGYDRSKNMGTIMWRLRDRFVSLQGFGYWFRNEPYPPADYPGDELNTPESITETLTAPQEHGDE